MDNDDNNAVITKTEFSLFFIMFLIILIIGLYIYEITYGYLATILILTIVILSNIKNSYK